MSEPLYVAAAPLGAATSPVLVVACSKHAYLPATREFLERRLELVEGRYHLLAVPGGPQLLVVSEHLPKFGWVGGRWLRFAGERLGVTRVILVAHEGCLWYEDERFVPALLHRLRHGGSAADHQREDLRRAAAALHELAAPFATEAYFIARAADGRLAFHREA